MKDTIAVNLDNAAHSRYADYAFNGFFRLGGKAYGTNALGVFLLEGDLDFGAQPIVASALTPVADFGAPQIKRVSDAYVHARTTGDLVLDVMVDEEPTASELPFAAPFKVDNGVRRFRAKLPKGAKGTNWQFRISNPDGARFTLFSLKTPPVVSQRST